MGWLAIRLEGESLIYYQYQCWRLGAGDGYHWAVADVEKQTHPFRLLIAHAEGEGGKDMPGEKRRATAQLELQFSREQLETLAVQVQALLQGSSEQ